VLLAVGGFVLIEGVRRLFEPPPVAAGVMVIFGLVGLLGNAVSILLLSRIQAGNLITRAALPSPRS
jgi:cobalt-zinc-cadmium efflux system protein